MSTPARQWDDLRARLITSVVLLLVGGFAIYMGGPLLLVVVAAFAGAMIWELVTMLSPRQKSAALVLPLLSALAVLGVATDIPFWAIILVPLVAGFAWLAEGKGTFFLYGLVVLTGTACFYVVREQDGIKLEILIVLIVVVTDVAGYFVGRFVGGPKFWPRVSPKKTWSGTVAGWVCSAIVGVILTGNSSYGAWVIVVCVALSLASQLGDIGESVIKRRVGVKDGSNLLPGHGGFVDRFDGMIAAFAGWAVIALLTDAVSGPF